MEPQDEKEKQHQSGFDEPLAFSHAPPQWMTTSSEYELIADSFDREFYVAQAKELALSDEDPIDHYLAKGWHDGLDPSPDFSTADYMEHSPELRSNNVNPLVHYLTVGRSEGKLRFPSRRIRVTQEAQQIHKLPHSVEAEGYFLHQINTIRAAFDVDYYVAQLPAPERTEEPIRHYLRKGWAANLDPSPSFSTLRYLTINADVKAAGMNPFFHYIAVGRSEGRKTGVPAESVPLPMRATELDSPDTGFSDYKEELINITETRQSENPAAFIAGETPSRVVFADDEKEKCKADELAISVEHIELNKESYLKLLSAGLVDVAWYQATYSDVTDAGIDPVKHYAYVGYKEGRRPNPYFDPYYYRSIAIGLNHDEDPLYHYVEIGEASGLRPVIYFDSRWYRDRYALSIDECCLHNYLVNRSTRERDPNRYFSVSFYLANNPDVKAAGIDPVLHYFEAGYKEGREHSPEFDDKYYRKKYLGGDESENPLLHFFMHEGEPNINPRMPDSEGVWSREVKFFTRPSPVFEERWPLPRSVKRRAKVLAYYLPQFHPFPENDEWWGLGFTEWTNVARGAPRFKGHYQPRIPRDLGFYDLLTEGVLRRQIDHALDAGLYGFIYYYYWFNGRRLMERPLELMLADASLNMPFCLMWANENWTRRWDGFESEVLIKQDYAPEDDVRLVQDFLRHFADTRYIRIGRRPLLMIYRPGIIPDAKQVIAGWRRLFKTLGSEEPIMVMAQGFGDSDPRIFGLDGAIEFPPHKITRDQPNIHERLVMLDPDFTGYVLSYDEAINRSLSEQHPDFPLIKAASPSWDNDARRQGGGMVLHGSTPALYQRWLDELIANARRNPFYGENLVCVNAWNEWAEGAYLEADVHFGGAYLNATARAVSGIYSSSYRQVVFVGHDAHPHGAQLLLLHMASLCRYRFGMDVRIILLNGGGLLSEYQAICSTEVTVTNAETEKALQAAYANGYRRAIVNSAASSRAVGPANGLGFHVTFLIHELPGIIAQHNLLPDLLRAGSAASRIIFPAELVRDRVMALANTVSSDRVLISPQGTYSNLQINDAMRLEARANLGLRDDSILVLGVGFADLRKGFDLFVSSWRAARRRSLRVHFAWVGNVDPIMDQYLRLELEFAKSTKAFHMIPFHKNMSTWFAAADIHLLTSREDPFPTVALEALQVGIPSIAFADAGGMPEMLSLHDAGEVVPLGDVEAIAEAIDKLDRRMALEGAEYKARLKNVAHSKFNFPEYVSSLLKSESKGYIKISVVVSNYNYGKYMATRLGSIFGQTYPVFEILVLDDCSSDDSISAIEACRSDWQREITIVKNEKNSGSVFHQWKRGVEMAKGDFVWIAEADDDSEIAFLELLSRAVEQEHEVVLAYSDSSAVDVDGEEISASYKFYYAEVAANVFDHDRIFVAKDFVRNYLSERNLILNVSCCLWNRRVLLAGINKAGEDLFRFRMAGDWLLYSLALAAVDGFVAYVAAPLNIHRRHASSVTHALGAAKHVQEIERVHERIRDITDDPELARRQANYLESVGRQLGVSGMIDATLHPPS